jgi:hypothetical protein
MIIPNVENIKFINDSAGIKINEAPTIAKIAYKTIFIL